MTTCHCLYTKMLAENPNPRTHKSLAFHTLAFCLCHPDRIPPIDPPFFFVYAYSVLPKILLFKPDIGKFCYTVTAQILTKT